MGWQTIYMGGGAKIYGSEVAKEFGSKMIILFLGWSGKKYLRVGWQTIKAMRWQKTGCGTAREILGWDGAKNFRGWSAKFLKMVWQNFLGLGWQETFCGWDWEILEGEWVIFLQGVEWQNEKLGDGRKGSLWVRDDESPMLTFSLLIYY